MDDRFDSFLKRKSCFIEKCEEEDNLRVLLKELENRGLIPSLQHISVLSKPIFNVGQTC